MDIGSVLLGLALLLVIAFLVARPLMDKPNIVEQPTTSAELLLASRERVLTQLRDLDFDHSMSKINEVDYAAQRAQLVAEGVAILKHLDALGQVADQAPEAPAAPATLTVARFEPADEIEAAVAQVRARRTGPAAGARLSAAARPSVDDEIEASVAAVTAARRANTLSAVEKLACSQCGAEALPADRFCARCGAPLPAPEAGLRQAKAQS